MGGRTILRNLRWAVAAIFFLFYSRVSAADMTSTLFVGKAQIDVVVENNGVSLPMEEVLRWVDAAAQAVGATTERFRFLIFPYTLLPFKEAAFAAG
jgi:hypothetical protein